MSIRPTDADLLQATSRLAKRMKELAQGKAAEAAMWRLLCAALLDRLLPVEVADRSVEFSEADLKDLRARGLSIEVVSTPDGVTMLRLFNEKDEQPPVPEPDVEFAPPPPAACPKCASTKPEKPGTRCWLTPHEFHNVPPPPEQPFCGTKYPPGTKT